MSLPSNKKRLSLILIGVMLIFVLVDTLNLINKKKLNNQKILIDIPTQNISTSSDIIQKANPITIVVFGDSVTAGYGISLDDAFPSQLERALINKGYEVQVINAGVSGDTTAGGLRRAEFIAVQKSDFVLVALGGNDVLRGIDPVSTKDNLRKTIQIFQRAGARVVLVGMRAPSNLGAEYVNKFNNIYPELAEELNVPLIPFLLEGVALKSEFNQNDGIHPNTEGARIIAEVNLLPKIVELLNKFERSK